MMINHNRLYLVILAVAAMLEATSIGLMLYLYHLSTYGHLGLKVPDDSLPLWIVLDLFYLIAIVVTLAIRGLNACLGRRLTKLLNVLLLPALPLGTAIGIYGLWKVDKRRVEKCVNSGK